MATEKKITSRIQHKHDVAANWEKATNFIPKKGEIIIYDAEYNTNGVETTPVRFKIGNGSATVNALPFAVIDYGSDIETLWQEVADNSTAIGTLQGTIVPKTRKINDKTLSSDITLGASDVGVTETAFPGLKKTGTVTSVAVKMNGAVKGTVTSSGTIDLGTVLTAHQDISGKANLKGGNSWTGNQQFNQGGYWFATDTNRPFVVELENGDALVTVNPNGVNYDSDGLGSMPFLLDGNAGTSGQVLTSQGTGITPVWSDVSYDKITGTPDLSVYQTKTDNTLNTNSKTVVGAINEVKGVADGAATKANSNAGVIADIQDGKVAVGEAKHATNATNVTDTINSKPISDIFESDGVTAKNATNAAEAAGVKQQLVISGWSEDAIDFPNTIIFSGRTEGLLEFKTTFTTGRAYDLGNNKITLDLRDTGVPAGQYSAVNVDAKGRVTAGGKSIEWGTSGQTAPSDDLMVGGLFLELQ